MKRTKLQWHTFAGGTGAPEGTHSYQAITGALNGRQQYLIDPAMSRTGRFVGYKLLGFGFPPHHGYAQIGDGVYSRYRSAMKAAQLHFDAQTVKSNPLKLRALGANMSKVETDDGVTVLFSFNTPVAAQIPGEGFFETEKKWGATTSNHIYKWLTSHGGRIGNVRKRPQSWFNSLVTATKRNPTKHRARPIKRSGVSKTRYLTRPSQITRGRPSRRLEARRDKVLQRPRAGYFPNPDAGGRGRWKLYDYDVWGNAKDGYEVNNVFHTSTVIEFDDGISDADLVKQMKKAGVMKASAKARLIEIDSDENTIYFNYNARPEFELRRETDD